MLGQLRLIEPVVGEARDALPGQADDAPVIDYALRRPADFLLR
jgi:hypothetical protein